MYAEYTNLLSFRVNKDVLLPYVNHMDSHVFVIAWKLWQQVVLPKCDDYFRNWTAGHANAAHGHRQTVVTILLDPKVDPSMKPMLNDIYDEFEYVAFKMVEDRINVDVRNRDRVSMVNKEAKASHDNAVWTQDVHNRATRSDALGHNSVPDAVARVMLPHPVARVMLQRTVARRDWFQWTH
jgi:hypothetical protein